MISYLSADEFCINSDELPIKEESRVEQAACAGVQSLLLQSASLQLQTASRWLILAAILLHDCSTLSLCAFFSGITLPILRGASCACEEGQHFLRHTTRCLHQ